MIFLVAFFFLFVQLPAVAILLSRLVQGPGRKPPLEPEVTTLDQLASVSAIVPTLNEADRIQPCLDGLTKQSYELREVIVVDSRSTDGTPGLVKDMADRDPRFRVMEDDPLPDGWVGRPWALHTGFLASSAQSKWFLGLDADTQPKPGLISSIVRAAEAEGVDLVTFSPQFILKDPGEMVLQPSLLMTLVYRFGPTGIESDDPSRVMANGQCFLCRRSVLEAVDGYTAAKGSFCDDVTLARHIAAQGYKVAFWDGAKLLGVRMYEGAIETWNEWGRSLDLKDAATPWQTWGDLWFLMSVQGLPLFVTVSMLPCVFDGWETIGLVSQAWFYLNAFLLAVRCLMGLAIAPSYDRSSSRWGWLFWLSPLTDVMAFFRILLSATTRPKQWRGRVYD
ncbi:MAG: 2'-O-glycosyltransferase CruG [Geitlerinemataceae cyanobacterium]